MLFSKRSLMFVLSVCYLFLTKKRDLKLCHAVLRSFLMFLMEQNNNTEYNTHSMYLVQCNCSGILNPFHIKQPYQPNHRNNFNILQ